MGTGAGKVPAYGMPISPLSEYAEKISRKRAERLLIDTPALVDLGHGTIRYREEGSTNPAAGDNGKSVKKTGYFYHARLTDYSEDATLHQRDEFKTKYIYQGPAKARGKSLYYVYGLGMDAKDQRQQALTGHRPQGRGYVWPSSYKNQNHFYYDLSFIIQDTEDDSDDDDDTEDVKTSVDPNLMRFSLHNDDTIDVLKKRVAVRLLIPSSILFINYDGRELGNDDVIARLRSTEEGEFKKFSVELTRLS